MKRVLYPVLLLIVSVIVFNCQKEISYPEDATPVVSTTPPAPITATVQGKIVDENNLSASGVIVKVGAKTATTDSKGYFRIVNASLDKNASLVTAEKTGYYKSYRSFQATSGANHISIKLIKKVLTGTIVSTAGGDVTLTNGTKITLPANAVVKAIGGSYNGTINVYAAYIDPTAADINQIVPGSFMADDKTGKRVTLTSFGMLAVELESDAGEKLQIANDKKAVLTAPIPASILSAAPATIPLWYVDEQTGIWKEEGTATKIGNTYSGEVKHFSFWNYDIGGAAINLSLTLKNAEGVPLVHVAVKITRISTTPWQSASGYTDSLGQVSGLVPSNETLKLDVLDNCNNSVFTQNIGPFTQNTNLGDITVSSTSSNVLVIKGKALNCSGAVVSNGFAIIDYDGYPRYATTNSSGQFSISLVRCAASPATCNITVVDNTAQQQATTTGIVITTPITDAGNLIACGTSSVQFFNYTVDGTNYALSSTVAQDSLSAFTNTQGSSPFYSLMNGFNQTAGKSIYLQFSSPMAAGTYPITYMSAQNHVATSPISPSNITITSFPISAGGFYEGNFSGSYKDSTNLTITHNVSGVFRIRR